MNVIVVADVPGTSHLLSEGQMLGNEEASSDWHIRQFGKYG